MVSAIVAVDNNWGIGYNGDLLERIPDDMRYFTELTTGHVVVMGRKTWDSIPNPPLKNRVNIVAKSDASFHIEQVDDTTYIVTVPNLTHLKESLKNYQDNSNRDVFIIGGGQIYKELLSICDRVYVTKIYKDHENVDTYFPNLDESDEWAPAACSNLRTHNDLSYQFWQYDRIS
jgi:dihydrofolate reductase